MDFECAKYTAIISDLHLCEAEPVHERFPLWKKFKTREFFYDDIFQEFLNHIQTKSNGEPIELVLNGDIFDFDSVTKLPEAPAFRVQWLEKISGLSPTEEKSLYKIQVIMKDHYLFFKALSAFIKTGNKVVFIYGNHDIELHFSAVRKMILQGLELSEEEKEKVRFVDWFYISNKDTLIEHGNQYDPYCVCEDPLNPMVKEYRGYSLKLPFGNLACRYIVNRMGFFNPHVDSNYIMSLTDYISIFFRYMFRAQPFLILTWLSGAVITMSHAFRDRLSSALRNPFQIENKVNETANNANASPRMVRELRELFVPPAASRPWLLLRELWLDRALLILITFLALFQLFSFIRTVYEISFFWMFVPLFAFLPFFLFYSRSFVSRVSSYKEPDETILAMASAITGVNRIVFGHTHIPRHEMIGFVEHLNSGCWSPAFLDIECKKPIDQKTFVWISPLPVAHEGRIAELLKFEDGESKRVSKSTQYRRDASIET